MAVLDFDRHFEKVRGETSEIRVRKQTFVLPPDLPVTWVLQTQAVPEDQVNWENACFSLLAVIFGEDTVTGWVGDGMGRDEYTQLVAKILMHYQERYSGGGGDPKAVSGSSENGS